MSASRLAWGTLPAGYQFGDAGKTPAVGLSTEFVRMYDEAADHTDQRTLATAQQRWRACHENAAAQLRAKAVWGGGYEAWRKKQDAANAAYPAERAAWDRAQRGVTANVIEGETDLP